MVEERRQSLKMKPENIRAQKFAKRSPKVDSVFLKACIFLKNSKIGNFGVLAVKKLGENMGILLMKNIPKMKFIRKMV
jgi:hypothetical protein